MLIGLTAAVSLCARAEEQPRLNLFGWTSHLSYNGLLACITCMPKAALSQFRTFSGSASMGQTSEDARVRVCGGRGEWEEAHGKEHRTSELIAPHACRIQDHQLQRQQGAATKQGYQGKCVPGGVQGGGEDWEGLHCTECR